ncbi:MAG: SDR family oxidoreductase [Microcystis wesenbergii Mw_MB_S_20031200_S109]|uniref:SDR family oxidoreductase n=1 Tax=Microcystis wesenbergii Mw_MB_S_20031200_S109D TaxID=2486241 RepID=A0A552LM72_9CHRO|nr:MAG: SDR family oxidoreductase [Microcystis wesenbergii Mw_MB_S_20031200_S109]TRV21313.1 MAG: SDR family oxidoreductase [Microcystis wesenbergii Mw_MB_S_20031200_S109D]
MTNLTNHKALITGASRRIGVAIASFLENQGTEIIAPMQLIKGFSPAMKTAGWGRVFNISSIFVYSVTKAGLNALTRSAALEFATYGILVNAVCPGYVGTELTFANNSPEQLAGIAASIPLQCRLSWVWWVQCTLRYIPPSEEVEGTTETQRTQRSIYPV